jgi:hypothetical protein
MSRKSMMWLRVVLALLAALLAAEAAWAARAGQTPQGLRFTSGGVSSEELRGLHELRGSYSLWVITAASKSGSYLTDVKLTIRDRARRVVFEDRLDGPWLFIDLPVGAYEVTAAREDQAQTRRTTIHRGDHHQVFFYFHTADEVGAGYQKPFEGNPYGKR